MPARFDRNEIVSDFLREINEVSARRNVGMLGPNWTQGSKNTEPPGRLNGPTTSSSLAHLAVFTVLGQSRKSIGTGRVSESETRGLGGLRQEPGLGNAGAATAGPMEGGAS